MQVFDDERAVLDQAGALVHHTYVTRTDGTFDVHLEPTSRHRSLAMNNGGFVTFAFFATLGDRYFPWFIRRELGSAPGRATR